MTSHEDSTPRAPSQAAPLARVVLATFLIIFVLARALVLLIMLRRIPSLYLHVHGAHVHHLNYGIFLLAVVGGILLFARPRGKSLSLVACLYGVAMALTFDEFGMWVHLGGPYWQRASFDAVVVVAALLALIAFAPAIRSFKPRQWLTAAAICLCVGLFAALLARSLRHAQERISPVLQQIEARAPS
jgi:hypothetical protein